MGAGEGEWCVERELEKGKEGGEVSEKQRKRSGRWTKGKDVIHQMYM